MPKPIVNNRINYQNIFGRVIQHDLFLNQGVRAGDSPTFGNLVVTGDTTIQGNLYVEGNTSLLDTNVMEFKDNIILVNNQETSAGVTLYQAGLEIDRGSLETFRIIYNELNSRVEVGVISNLQPIALRESNPLSNGIITWNSNINLMESTNEIRIPMSFTSTTNSVSSTSGAIIIAGGIGVKKDLFIDGKIFLTGSNLPNYSVIYTDAGTNTLNISSVQDINLTPNGKILLPYDKLMSFGNISQSILANSLTNNLSITSAGDINLLPTIGKKINIPNQIPITFSTPNEKIYTDSSNNMIIAGSQDIYLYPNNGNGGGGKKIFTPVDTPIVFGNVGQSILSNINNDLSISANNNIFLNPGNTLDIKIPTDAGLRFGSGYQRITANSNNDLLIYSSGDLYLNSNNQVKLPVGIPLTFASNNQYIFGDSIGNMIIGTSNTIKIDSKIQNTNTENSISATSGSIYTYGGLGVVKDIICNSSIIVNSSNDNALNIKNDTSDLLTVSTNFFGKMNVFTGDGTSLHPSIEISDYSLLNAQSLIQLKSSFDNTNGYMIGRGTVVLNEGRTLSVNLPNYTDYSNNGPRAKFSITSNDCSTELFSIESETGDIFILGTLGLSNTIDSTSPSTGSFIVHGGLGIEKSIYTSGKYISSVDSTTAFQIQDSTATTLFNIDSINNEITINQKVIINKQDLNAFKITDNTNTVLNVNTLNNNLSTTLQLIINNTNDSTNISSGSIITNGGIAIQKNLNVGGESVLHGINMSNTRITNLLDPLNSQDSATKGYVDMIRQGLFVKDSVNVASLINGNLNSDFVSGSIIDNYILNLDDRILIKNQTNPIENGLYKITNNIPIRTIDLASGTNASGIFVFVKSGDINSSLGWICNSQSPLDIVDTDPLTFTEFTGLGQIQAGNGLSKNFNEININVDDSSIEINSDSLRIKNSAVSTGLTGGSGDPLQTTSDQSHVTKLGTINSGIWQGNNIAIGYGGTGKTIFNTGNILFGNDTNPINTDPNFFYDINNVRFGLGTNSPSKDFEIKSNNTISLLLNADSDANNFNAKPEIILTYNSHNSYIGLTRNYNEYAADIYTDALVLETPSVMQFATHNTSRITILQNGFVGINTSTPSTTLDINGSLNISDTTSSSSLLNGSVVLSGGLSISCIENSTSIYNGGGLTVGGGASISKDLYVGGAINSISSSPSTFSYLTITASDEAVNLTSGGLVTFGGITIQCATDASSVTNGGSFLSAGGASIGKSLYIGSNMYVKHDTYLHNLYFTSTNTTNYIQSPDSSKTTNSFLPTNFTQYNNTSENILTIANSGIVLNDQHSIQIGGKLNAIDGYTIQFNTSGNLGIIPNSTNYNINFGTIGNYTNLNIYGNDGSVKWNSTNSFLQFSNVSIGSILIGTPDINYTSYIQASGANMIMNIGGNGDSQLTTILSNKTGNSNITFTPNDTVSNLVLTNNIITTFNGIVENKDIVEYSGNALHQTINNNTSNSVWYYFGTVSDYCEIDFNNGINTTQNDISGLKLTIAINDTTCITAHSHYGNILYNSNQKPIAYIYNDNSNNYNLFVKMAGYSQTNINVTAQQNSKFVLLQEGNGNHPNGTFSGFLINWIQEYSTNIESTLKYTTGDLTVEGTSLNVCDNFPIIGYNNKNVNSSRNLGILFQRYQISNDIGSGDIVDDNNNPIFIDSIPNQSLIVVLDQLKLSTLTSTIDNYYTGWWIKVASGTNTNQVRKIISYNGLQRVATLDSPFTNQNPNSGDTISFYNNGYAVNYYDEINDTFAFGYTNYKNGYNSDTNLRIKGLYTTNTMESTNSSTGSLHLLGGISIDNTSDAISSTCGGTITTAGGISINKNLIVGTNIGIGRDGFTPQESIHLKKNSSTVRLEHSTNSFSYIDFVESSTTNRYGILLDSSTNEFSLTNTNTSQTPNNSNKAFTINNLGYIGINTVSPQSPLTLNVNNFISTNSSTGFLGLIGGASNDNNNNIASRMLLNANLNSGCLNLYAGNVSSGNVSIYTNNDIERLRIGNNGIITVISNQISDNMSGAFITNGGITIMSTQNSTSITSGGALTVNGGVAINKDIYIGGNIFIEGSFTAAGSVRNPNISFSNFLNCSLIEYFNNNLSVSGSLRVLTFAFSVIPTHDSVNCEVEIILPERTNAFISRFEVISNVSGYTDDTNVIPLFNIIGCGIVGTPNLLVKFQSASTNTHYIQVQCTYILA